MSTLVVLNARAGTLYSGGLDDPGGMVERAFERHGHPAQVVLAEPDEIGKHLEDAAKSDEIDTIVVGGGDGSFSHALEALAESGKTLGLLPLGTMNLLGRDLGFPQGGLAEMAEALAQGEVETADLALLNGRPFHTLCGLGYFARVARQRELTRLNIPFGRAISVLLSTARSFFKSGRMDVEVDVDGHVVQARAYAVLVTNNRIGNDWRRASLDEGLLEVHLMHDATIVRRVRAGIELLTGSWREGESIESYQGRCIKVSTRRSRVWLAVDGELRREKTPLVFELKPHGVSMLIPKQVDAPAEAGSGI